MEAETCAAASGGSGDACKLAAVKDKTAVQRIRARLWRFYYSYLLVTAASTLEPVEVFVFNSVILALLVLIGYYGFALLTYSVACAVVSLPAGILPQWIDAAFAQGDLGQAAAARIAAVA